MKLFSQNKTTEVKYDFYAHCLFTETDGRGIYLPKSKQTYRKNRLFDQFFIIFNHTKKFIFLKVRYFQNLLSFVPEILKLDNSILQSLGFISH